MARGKVFEVALQIGAELDSGVNAAFSSARGQIEALGRSLSNLKNTSARMDSWRQLGTSVRSTSQQLGAAKQEVARLGVAMSQTANPTAKMRREFEAAAQRVHTLENRLQSQRAELHSVSDALKAAGVDTKHFGAEQAKLNEQIAKMGKLSGQIQANRTARDANRARGKELRGQITGMWSSVLAVGAPFALSAKYEKELNKTRAIGSLSAEDAARQDALYRRLGAETEYSASEAARTGVAMTRAGFSTEQIERGLPAILDMATASDMGLEQTASILGDTMNAFGIDASQMAHIADVLSKSANIANTDVAMLGETFKFVAPSAKTLSVSMEQVGAMAGVMADAGIKGTMGGTTLREMLSSLAAPSSTAEKAMKQIGLATRDAGGNMLDMQSILASLSEKLKGVGNAEKLEILNDIAGKRGGSGLMSILDALETGKLDAKLAAINNSAGYALQTAAVMREGISGSVSRLSSAVEGFTLNLVTKETGAALAAQVDAMAKWVGAAAKWVAENPKLVNSLVELGKTFVTVKLAILGGMYAWTQIKGVWLTAKSVVLSVRAAMLLAQGGMKLVTAAGLENAAAVRAITLAQKAHNLALGAGKWAWATAQMAAHKVATLAWAGVSKAATAAQWLFNAALNANPIGLVITAIAGLTAAGIALYKNWDTVKEKMGAAWDGIKEKGQEVADWFKKLPDEMVDMVLGLPAKLAEAMGALGNWVKAKLKDMFTIDISFGNIFSGKDGKTASDEIFAAAFGTVGGSAAGGRFTRPTLSLIGEGDSPKYVIPTQGRYKNNGLALWQQAGRDLGVPMFGGGSKVGTTPAASFALPRRSLKNEVFNNVAGALAGMSLAQSFQAKTGKPSLAGEILGGLAGFAASRLMQSTEPAVINVYQTTNITLANESQKKDVLAAMDEAIKNLADKVKEALYNKDNKRLAFQ